MLGFGIKEESTTTGTGNLTIAAVTGFPRFSDAFPHAKANQFFYSILDDAGLPIEHGIGRLTTDANTLVRLKVLATYVSGTYDNLAPAAATLAAGTKTVICSGAVGLSMLSNANYLGTVEKSVVARHQNNVTNSGIVADNIWEMWPIQFYTAAEVTDVIFRSVGTAAGKSVRFGLYNIDTDGTPGKVLIDTGNVDCTSASVKTVTLGTPVFVPAGVYYIAWAADSTALTFSCSGIQSFADNSFGRANGTAEVVFAIRMTSMTFGTAFTDDPAGTPYAYTAAQSRPHVFFKVA